MSAEKNNSGVFGFHGAAREVGKFGTELPPEELLEVFHILLGQEYTQKTAHSVRQLTEIFRDYGALEGQVPKKQLGEVDALVVRLGKRWAERACIADGRFMSELSPAQRVNVVFAVNALAKIPETNERQIEKNRERFQSFYLNVNDFQRRNASLRESELYGGFEDGDRRQMMRGFEGSSYEIGDRISSVLRPWRGEALLYLMKNMLIWEDYVSHSSAEEKRNRKRIVMVSPQKLGKRDPDNEKQYSYTFSEHRARIHFMPSHMPFSMVAREYIRERQNKRHIA